MMPESVSTLFTKTRIRGTLRKASKRELYVVVKTRNFLQQKWLSTNNTHVTSLALAVTTFHNKWPESMLDQLSWSTDKPSPTNAAFTPSTDKQAKEAGDRASMAADMDEEARTATPWRKEPWQQQYQQCRYYRTQQKFHEK
jgi:hypothetical protein